MNTKSIFQCLITPTLQYNNFCEFDLNLMRMKCKFVQQFNGKQYMQSEMINYICHTKMMLITIYSYTEWYGNECRMKMNEQIQ